MVLLWIQYFQQRARWIPPEIGAQLINLIEQEQRVARSYLVEALQHFSGHGTDIGATMTTNLCLIAHASKRHADVLAARGFGDRLTQGSLADTRWADEAQDRRLHLIHALLYRKVLHDAILDFFKAVMVFVQYQFRVQQIVLDLGLLAPRQACEYVNVVAYHRCFR